MRRRRTSTSYLEQDCQGTSKVVHGDLPAGQRHYEFIITHYYLLLVLVTCYYCAIICHYDDGNNRQYS